MSEDDEKQTRSQTPTLPHTPARARRPSPIRALRRGLSLVWDNLGLVVGINLGWMLILLLFSAAVYGEAAIVHHGGAHGLGARASSPLLMLIGLALSGAMAAGPAAALALRARQEAASLTDFVQGVRRDGLRYATLTLILVIVVGECLFYFGWLLRLGPLRLLSPLPLYLSAFWLVAAPYQFALVSLENRGFKDTLKRSCLLVLDNPVYSVMTSFAMAAVAVALIISGVGLALAAGATWLALSQSMTLEALRKYRPEDVEADE